MKKLIALLLAGFALIGPVRSAESDVAWDRFPVEKLTDLASLQNGARLFVNYCLNCHSAAFMRYNRLRDIGISEDQVRDNLMFATDKVGETMKVALDPRQAKEWFGGVPPDLTVIARSRAVAGKGSGADYLYTYLRAYYRDDATPTGWNNVVYPNVGMPNVLWELQGQRRPRFVEAEDPHAPGKTVLRQAGFEQLTPGTLSPLAFDDAVADLVAYMQWMGEPAQNDRTRIGVWVLLFLAVFTFLAWRLNAAYWKDVK